MEFLRFLKTNSGKKGEGMPVVRNPQFYFREGFCWIDVSKENIKCRIKSSGVFDVLSMSLFSVCELPDWYFVSLINSTFVGQYVNTLINTTVHFQINDARQLPIIIPTQTQLGEFKAIFEKAVSLKKQGSSQKALDTLEKELDEKVLRLYGI